MPFSLTLFSYLHTSFVTLSTCLPTYLHLSIYHLYHLSIYLFMYFYCHHLYLLICFTYLSISLFHQWYLLPFLFICYRLSSVSIYLSIYLSYSSNMNLFLLVTQGSSLTFWHPRDCSPLITNSVNKASITFIWRKGYVLYRKKFIVLYYIDASDTSWSCLDDFDHPKCSLF